MNQLSLFDLLHKPVMKLPIDLELGVIQGDAETFIYLPHKRMAWHQAEIELHPHSDGTWMWSTSFQTANRGAGYKVGPKWGKFAESKSDAFFYACQEMRDRLQSNPDQDAKLILSWLNNVSIGWF